MKLINLFVGGLFFIFAYPSIAQITEFNFLYYSKDQGLPDNRIYDFQEDLKGRIWIATQTGVSCFDGKKFINYIHPLAESDIEIDWLGYHLLTLDTRGRIWEATTRQLFYFDEKLDKFIEYDLSEFEAGIPKISWQSAMFLQDWQDEKSIWFRKGLGIYAINSDDMICRLKRQIPYSNRNVWGLLGKDIEGNIAFGDWYTNSITFLRPDGSYFRTGVTSTWQNMIFQQNGKDQIWVGSKQLMSYDKITGKWEKWTSNSTGVSDFAGITTIPVLTGDSVLWMYGHYHTDVTCFNTIQKKFALTFPTEQFNQKGLRCGLLNAMFVDSKSNVWLGGNAGVSVIMSSEVQFEKYLEDNPKGTFQGRISAKNTPEPYAGGTWKMPDGSLAEWVADGDTLYYIALSDHSKAYFKGQNLGDVISGTSKFIDLQTGERTIKQLNYRKNESNEWFELNSMDTIVEAGKALIYWSATNDRIKVLKGEKFVVEKDMSGSWYGDGILAYYFQDDDSLVFVHPTHFFHGKRTKPNFFEGLQIRWWGGCRTEMKTNFNFVTPDSLFNVFKVLDNNCDLKKGETRSSGSKRPLWKKENDSIYIHTFRIFDKIQPLNPAEYQQKTFELDYSKNFISFEFDCANPTYSLLWYKLEGFDHDWFQTRSNKLANYTNLDGGDYTFRVKAQDENGLEMGPMATFRLYVNPPYYRTWWFYGICLITTGLIFYGIFRYREIQRLRQEQLRLHIARDLHDEVGSTLSSISILSESALLGVQKDLDQARFGNIGDKARAALDSISDIVWSINPKNDSMEMILSRMSAYASEMLETGGTVVRIHIGEGVESITLPMAIRKDFYLLFKEAIHNCTKHAHAKHVEVKLDKHGNTLNMSVRDDGVGFDIENGIPGMVSLGGNGLQNMHNRAKAMGGKFSVHSTLGTGTEIQLELPI